MTPSRRLAFTQKWTNEREAVFAQEADKPPLSKTKPKTSIYNYILDKRVRIEPVGFARPHGKLWVIWGYQWNRFSKRWSNLKLFHCREFELEDQWLA